ncbi:hypothetical protein CKO51_25775 [Rhodopirellula sp. SM50]|nr:phenylacetate--CoA ligase family protein [Rhodopirellula sp. SM50]PAY16588.1 hypothetical protein CKO51_25775 [Rhodopirellula sp. SM50]
MPLKRLLAHAQANVPFYHDRLQEPDSSVATVSDLLNAVPVTTKDDIEANFPDGVTDGSDPADWRMMSTRGTAQRLITIQGFEKRDAVRAANLRMLRLAGGYRPGMPMVEIPPEVCENVCGEMGEEDEGVLSHLWSMLRERRLREQKSIRDLRGLVERNWIFNRKTYSGFGIHGSHPPPEILDQYVAGLRRDRPYLLKALATYLTTIAKHLRDSDAKPLSIPVIKTMGSRVTPGQRELLETSFGGKFWDDYGSAEFGSIACECDQHHGLHVFDDFFIVEVVDANGGRVADGELGWVLVTDLMNLTMPLIRYKIGDVGRIDHSPCACGRTGPRLTVTGRAHDVIVDREGGWCTTDDVVDFLESQPVVDSAQVSVKSKGWYEIAAVAIRNASIERGVLAASFAQWIGGQPRVDVNVVSTLRPEAGGKFRYVRGDLERR